MKSVTLFIFDYSDSAPITMFFSSHHQAILLTPPACPTIQLNSVTTYLEIAPGPTGCGLSPTRPPHPYTLCQDTNSNIQVVSLLLSE